MATPEEMWDEMGYIPGLFAASANLGGLTPETVSKAISSAIVNVNKGGGDNAFSSFAPLQSFENLGPAMVSYPTPAELYGNPWDPTGAINAPVASSGGPAGPVYVGTRGAREGYGTYVTDNPQVHNLPAVNDSRVTGLTDDEFDLLWAQNYQAGVAEADIPYLPTPHHKAPTLGQASAILKKAGVEVPSPTGDPRPGERTAVTTVDTPEKALLPTLWDYFSGGGVQSPQYQGDPTPFINTRTTNLSQIDPFYSTEDMGYGINDPAPITQPVTPAALRNLSEVEGFYPQEGDPERPPAVVNTTEEATDITTPDPTNMGAVGEFPLGSVNAQGQVLVSSPQTGQTFWVDKNVADSGLYDVESGDTTDFGGGGGSVPQPGITNPAVAAANTFNPPVPAAGTVPATPAAGPVLGTGTTPIGDLYGASLNPFQQYKQYQMGRMGAGAPLSVLASTAGQGALAGGYQPAYGRFLLNRAEGFGQGGDAASEGQAFSRWLSGDQRRPIQDVRSAYGNLMNYLGQIGGEFDLSNLNQNYYTTFGPTPDRDDILAASQAAMGLGSGMGARSYRNLGSLYDVMQQQYGPQAAGKFAQFVGGAFGSPQPSRTKIVGQITPEEAFGATGSLLNKGTAGWVPGTEYGSGPSAGQSVFGLNENMSDYEKQLATSGYMP